MSDNVLNVCHPVSAGKYSGYNIQKSEILECRKHI